MASKQEIEKELKIALKEVGKITPWYDKRFHCWIFSSALYPSVEYAGETKEEVIKNYKYYLKDFIIERLKNNIEPHVEKKTKGRGGWRPGAGRPQGTTKEPKKRIYVPEDLVDWLQGHWSEVRNLKLQFNRKHA